jgi:hypothetical protein
MPHYKPQGSTITVHIKWYRNEICDLLQLQTLSVIAIWYIQIKQVKEQVNTHIKLCRNESEMRQPGQCHLTASGKVWIFGYGNKF